MTNKELVAKCLDIAKNYKTLYVFGCPGAPLNTSNKQIYTKNYSYNMRSDRTAMIQQASSDTFGFDCSCLIKSILWGWNGKLNHACGGAIYQSNGVPDINANTMISKCSAVSNNFNNITPGEVVWMTGHIGVYIGDGLAVECTPSWKNGVQITACNCVKSGYQSRYWTKHGKLPYITYVSTSDNATIERIAKEVIAGKWGTGATRKQKLTAAGYNYNEVQAAVNKIMKTR